MTITLDESAPGMYDAVILGGRRTQQTERPDDTGCGQR